MYWLKISALAISPLKVPQDHSLLMGGAGHHCPSPHSLSESASIVRTHELDVKRQDRLFRRIARVNHNIGGHARNRLIVRIIEGDFHRNFFGRIRTI